MIPIDVVGVRLEVPSNQPVLLLRERGGSRYLPIWIGVAEATAIAMTESGMEPPRPLTQDLVRLVLEAAKVDLLRVEISDLAEGVFYADMVLSNGVVISARPSDAVAVALRTGSETLVAEHVLEAAGVPAPLDEDTEVEAFREFLESVTPEEFGGRESQS
ncbi:MAG: bifunctional nuclease family protein [Candidatus Nanopelagicales bacterium]|nr:bifunctional nuclease family protein [Candidatus Nanopelagicales bacterium]